MQEITAKLFELQDLEYREFHSNLVPTKDPDAIIGVRVPHLRKLAKELIKEMDVTPFLKELPHQYNEENVLHAFFIEAIKDYDECLLELNQFLPYVDNWAVCDSLKPKVFKKHLDELVDEIQGWIESTQTYTIRFGIEMLMNFYLDEKFSAKYLDMAAGVKSEEYYVNMMIAWYFATALAKQYDATIKIIEAGVLDKWTHNKTIQKAIESYRITPEQKEYLRGLKK
ncbi:MAG: DNA alkylation repair protein [Lachnospiraceae bacterium]|nr:DNA alkylation repair protein [Lachnospiraceae bacterium]